MSHLDEDGDLSLFTALPRALAAAFCAAIGYVCTLAALNPGTGIFEQVLVHALANYIAIGTALLIFAAVFWRLMKGLSMREEIDRALDIDIP